MFPKTETWIICPSFLSPIRVACRPGMLGEIINLSEAPLFYPTNEDVMLFVGFL